MNIYEVPEARRYWVVRAEGGHYFDHFIKYGIVALGHLNSLHLDDCENVNEKYAWDNLKDRYKKSHLATNGTKQQASSHLAQIKAFLFEMNTGDWVITVGRGGVRFGRVLGRPFVKKEKLTVVYGPEGNRAETMEMHLQRPVEWGPSLSRGNLPYGLQLSLKANQTVFSLDSRWDSIYHSLYPAFTRGDQLFLSAKIKQKDGIRNHNISTIFRLLDEVEVIGKEFAAKRSAQNFETTFAEYIDNDWLTNTTKAQFHSPGDIWNAISNLVGDIAPKEWIQYTVLAYAMVFGNTKLGFDGLIDVATRQKLWDLVISRKTVNKADKVVEAVQLELPSIDTSALESTKKDKL